MNKYDFSPKSELKAIHELPDPFLKPDGTAEQLGKPIGSDSENGKRSSGNTLRRC